jgi:hypothetical protein
VGTAEFESALECAGAFRVAWWKIEELIPSAMACAGLNVVPGALARSPAPSTEMVLINGFLGSRENSAAQIGPGRTPETSTETAALAAIEQTRMIRTGFMQAPQE